VGELHFLLWVSVRTIFPSAAQVRVEHGDARSRFVSSAKAMHSEIVRMRTEWRSDDGERLRVALDETSIPACKS